jgi:hypothetical protein
MRLALRVLTLGVGENVSKSELAAGSRELQVPPLRCAPVGMTKFRLVDHLIICYTGSTEAADPSTTLRSGRDDNSVWTPAFLTPKQNCHPDRSVA